VGQIDYDDDDDDENEDDGNGTVLEIQAGLDKHRVYASD